MSTIARFREYEIEDEKARIEIENLYFDNVESMKAATTLKSGDVVKTLGYYSINDGGSSTYKIRTKLIEDIDDNGSIQFLQNNLVAELLIKNNSINIKQLGAKDDGITDNSKIINNALTLFDRVLIPTGDYLINDTLNMRFNTILEGITSDKTRLIVGDGLENKIIINYGNSYSYGDKRGCIKHVVFINSDDSKRLGLGLMIYSGIDLIDVRFSRLKVAIQKPSNYIDKITLTNCGVGYCSGTDKLYAVNLTGNGDELKFDTFTLQSSYDESSFDEHCGVLIRYSNGGYIKNSILNGPLIIENCKAFSVENTHHEGSQIGSYISNKSFVKFSNSNITMRNCFLHKRCDGGNIIIKQSEGEHTSAIVKLENINFVINEYNFNSHNSNKCNYEIEKDYASILVLKNVSMSCDFSSSWTPTFENNGVRIKDNEKFNNNSSYYSINSIIGTDNEIQTAIPELNDIFSDSNFLNYSSAHSKIPFYQSGLSANEQHIKCVIVFDENRKLAVKKSSNVTVTGVTSSDNEGKNGKGVLISLGTSASREFTGKGLMLWYYRGNSNGSYNKLTKIPVISGAKAFDFGTYVNGCITNDRTEGDIDTFNYVSKCSKNGDNVTFYSANIPTVGTFIKGDRCINKNISTGNVKSWIYNGNEWISEGNYL